MWNPLGSLPPPNTGALSAYSPAQQAPVAGQIPLGPLGANGQPLAPHRPHGGHNLHPLFEYGRNRDPFDFGMFGRERGPMASLSDPEGYKLAIGNWYQQRPSEFGAGGWPGYRAASAQLGGPQGLLQWGQDYRDWMTARPQREDF